MTCDAATERKSSHPKKRHLSESPGKLSAGSENCVTVVGVKKILALLVFIGAASTAFFTVEKFRLARISHE